MVASPNNNLPSDSEQPLSSMVRGGGEAAITGAVPSPELTGSEETVSRVLQVIVAAAFVSCRRCTRLHDDTVSYIRSLTVACSYLLQSERLVIANTETLSEDTPPSVAEQPLSSVVHGGGEAAITGAVLSESQPAEESVLTLTGGEETVSRVLQRIVAAAFVSCQRCARLLHDCVLYLKSDRRVFVSLAARLPGARRQICYDHGDIGVGDSACRRARTEAHRGR